MPTEIMLLQFVVLGIIIMIRAIVSTFAKLGAEIRTTCTLTHSTS